MRVSEELMEQGGDSGLASPMWGMGLVSAFGYLPSSYLYVRRGSYDTYPGAVVSS